MSSEITPTTDVGEKPAFEILNHDETNPEKETHKSRHLAIADLESGRSYLHNSKGSMS